MIRPKTHGENPLRGDWVARGDFVVAYSGNLGRAHEIATMLMAIRLTEAAACHDTAQATEQPGPAPPRIVWLFVGGGAQMEALQREVAECAMTTVIFKPYQPQDRLADSLSVADVHLISLRPELEGLIVPSKVYGIQAAGRAAIFIGDRHGEIAHQLTRTESGLVVAAGDGAGLAAAVAALAADPARCCGLGENARQAFEREFDKPLAMQRWEAVLTEVAGGTKTA